MFIRRFYYDVNTGEQLYSYTAEGKRLYPKPQNAEAQALHLENWGCMKWTTPDAAIEAAFSEVDAEGNPRMVDVSVDVSGAEPQLVFNYTPIEDIEGDDPYEIIDILTGGEA